MHSGLYDAYVTESAEFIFPSDITSIDDINVFIGNGDLPFILPDNPAANATARTIGKAPSLTKFVSDSQPTGFFMEYYVPQLTSGGTFTFADILRARWTGEVDQDWDNPNNWVNNKKATYFRNTFIPGDVPNHPIIGQYQLEYCLSLNLLCDSHLILDMNSTLNVTNQPDLGTKLDPNAILHLRAGAKLSADLFAN